MSRAPGAGLCEKPMWWGYGAPAGCCEAEAYGPTRKGLDGMPLLWACPQHGGPPKTPETELLRNGAMARERAAS